MNGFDIASIRQSNPIPEVLARRGWELNPAGSLGFRGPCPIHRGENDSAFSVQKDGEKFYCFSCNEKGDVVELVMQLDGVSFETACRTLGGDRPEAPAVQSAKKIPSAPVPVAKKAGPSTAVYSATFPALSLGQIDEATRIWRRLADDKPLQHQIAESRGWEPATIEMLVQRAQGLPHGQLGWMEAKSHDTGHIAFLFRRAIKYRTLFRDTTAPGGWRWHQSDGKKTVRWLWGKWAWNSSELWMESTEDGLPVEKGRVILLEGEPDTVTALDSFLADARTAVVGLPSATIGRELAGRLPMVLRDRDVLFVADRDPAGQKSIETLTGILRGHARSLRVVNLAAA